MTNNSFTQVLEKVATKIAIFESPREVDGFLKEAISLLMDQVDAALGAVFVYDDPSNELVFRVGYDKGDFLDQMRCGTNGAPKRFSLDDSEVGKAFTGGAIRYINFDQVENHPFHSKILIPIIRGPEKIGVFLMAHQEKEAFLHLDQADLMQAVALLGDMLAEAMILLNYDKPNEIELDYKKSHILKGMKTSDGIAEGFALPVWADIETAAEHLPPPGTKEDEILLFDKALNASLKQLEDLQDSAATVDTEMVALIFTAQMYMLKDSSFIGKMRSMIEEGVPASKSVRIVINDYADRFSRMTEVRLAEKAQDVRDLGFRLVTNMGRPVEKGFSYEGQIVISRHIYPSDLYRLAVEKVAGLVLQGAGVTAHISILARSLNLPVLITDDKSLLSIPEGTPLLLDASGGQLFINPDKLTRKSIFDRQKKEDEKRTIYTLKGRTSDDVSISVSANINILKDAKEAIKQGAEGIGLYRSEFPFILKNDFLSEEQQYRILQVHSS